LLIASCGGGAPTFEPVETEIPTQAVIAENTQLPSSTAEPTQTLTPEPTATQTPSITPTDTPLPPLELPTEIANAPARMVWDGTPTYLADSTPGFAFRVTYDPSLWAVTNDQFGFPALGHRNIEYCVIAVTAGRGLPANVTVEHEILYLPNNLTFDVNTGFENGVKKFVTYTGSDRVILTAFEVTFQEQADECLADALTVLSTLRAVPVSQATPQPTP
jgi:hypothetical protein